MNRSIPASLRRGRLWARLTVALACAGAVTFTGLPGLPLVGEAHADIKGGKRCDKKYGLPSKPGGRKPGDLPHDWVRPDVEQDVMPFENDRRAMDGLNLPKDPDDYLKGVGNDPKKYEEGDPKKVFASYKRYLGNRPAGSNTEFRDWLVNDYVDMAERRTRGDAFERKVAKDYNLVGPEWLCQVTVEIPDPDDPTGKRKIRRIYDAYNKDTKQFLEFKAGGEHAAKQVPKDQKILNHKDYKGHSLRYVLGGEQEDATRRALSKLNKDVGGTDTSRRVSTIEHRTTPKEQWRRSIYSQKSTFFNATPQPNNNPGSKVVQRSAPTPETARRQQEAAMRRNMNGSGVRTPGGIDFSTLDLRYVGTPVKGKGLDYAFSADKAADPVKNPGYGGEAKANLISDAFFTWLALTPDKFWVNLNPVRPDVVMDKEFAKTDAGRVLLESDLTLKHDYADAMNPDKYQRGETFWRTVPRTAEGQPCLPIIRQWITPKTAQVREQDGGIYILDAPLKVNMEVPTGPDVPPNTCKISETQTKQAERLIKTMILPELERRVNEDASYADLRRVYTSRVAAEYIRRQDAAKPSDYRKIINSNDVKRWPLRGVNKGWDKKTVFDKYVHSFKNGDYKFKRTYGGKVWILSMGGVDFSKAPKRNITRARFNVQHPNLPKSTKTGVQAMTNDLDNDKKLLLGGNSVNKGGGDGDGPTPTQPPTDDPTEQPTTPAPDPSTPGGGDHGRPPAGKNPDGDLADTGSHTPVGLIAGIAAALAAAGAALTWWTRRRKQETAG
ncbi:hypothetical protein ACIRPT_04735 [Streptomyces sp. NPDC101227]|uniref:hypothetical protein n=1 Tax=Streptomyces sp. NPDC101227 TaxID=3366136 RepID=UPI003821A74B